MIAGRGKSQVDSLKTVSGFSRVFILITDLYLFGYCSMHEAYAYNYCVGAMGLIFS